MGDKEAKFKIGDLVSLKGSRAVVKSVLEKNYFSYISDVYYEYVIEMESGETHTVVESALERITDKKANGCECGAWAVHWAVNNHSYWCVMYRDKSSLVDS